MPGLTFRVFIEEWREVVVRTFGNDALRQEEEAAMTEFVNIWLSKLAAALLWCSLTNCSLSPIRGKAP